MIQAHQLSFEGRRICLSDVIEEVFVCHLRKKHGGVVTRSFVAWRAKRRVTVLDGLRVHGANQSLVCLRVSVGFRDQLDLSIVALAALLEVLGLVAGPRRAKISQIIDQGL